MKYKVHSIKNNHICCDILNDDDTLIMGGYMQCIETVPTDMDAFFTERIYPQITAMLAPGPETDTILIEASPILQAMENTKESLKFDLIAYIKSHPAVTLTDFLAYCDQAFGWQEAGFVMKMMYEYINQAEKKGMVELSGTSKEYYFEVLRQIVLGSTDDELKERLK